LKKKRQHSLTYSQFNLEENQEKYKREPNTKLFIIVFREILKTKKIEKKKLKKKTKPELLII